MLMNFLSQPIFPHVDQKFMHLNNSKPLSSQQGHDEQQGLLMRSCGVCKDTKLFEICLLDAYFKVAAFHVAGRRAGKLDTTRD